MRSRIRTFKNFGLKPVYDHTFLLLRMEIIRVNGEFFSDPSDQNAEDLFKLLERWRKRKK